MTTRIRNTSLLTLAAVAVCVGSAATANAANLALGKSYAYFGGTLPGQAGGHYQDDSHAGALGDFNTGELTDGILLGDAGQPGLGSIPAPELGVHRSGQDGTLGAPEAPPIDIIIDLTTSSTVNDIVIGTGVGAGGNSNPPDDVTISYSTTGIAPGDFGSAQYYDLQTMFGPLADGHSDMPLVVGGVSARYVKFAFDGGSMQEPNGTDPNEKYMLDEITINGDAIPEPSAFLLAALGLLGLLGWGRRMRRRAA